MLVTTGSLVRLSERISGGLVSPSQTVSGRGTWMQLVSQPPGTPHRSELEFRRLLATLPVAAYTCDSGGLITYFNERAVKL